MAISMPHNHCDCGPATTH